ncbi:MAG: acyl-CoA dehydrogenase C-terminal domain-containing protein [Alphaproteobacteria bacterium]|nr:acyl-CoA dehydrogenase C-terminal domain-containing protein [Alphaproteobacteria bacterium]
MADGAEDTEFLEAKRLIARFYAETLLPQYAGLLAAVEAAGGAELEMAAEQF